MNTIADTDYYHQLIDDYTTISVNSIRLFVLKINLNKLGHVYIDFCKDELMLKVINNSCFTYYNIPSYCITDVTSDKLLKYLSIL